MQQTRVFSGGATKRDFLRNLRFSLF